MPPILQRFKTTQVGCKSILVYGVLHVGPKPITKMLGIGRRMTLQMSARLQTFAPTGGNTNASHAVMIYLHERVICGVSYIALHESQGPVNEPLRIGRCLIHKKSIVRNDGTPRGSLVINQSGYRY